MFTTIGKNFLKCDYQFTVVYSTQQFSNYNNNNNNY